jgi:hypothetical protein
VVRSGREQNYAVGKDTGRYWDAGAVNVHWVIVTDDQVERGIKEAIARVNAPGVFIEGNSILEFIQADFVLMVSRAGGGKIKGSGRQALSRCSAIYLSTNPGEANDAKARFAAWRKTSAVDKLIGDLPIYCAEDLATLIGLVQQAAYKGHAVARVAVSTPHDGILPG